MKMIFLVDGDNNIGTGLQGIDLLTAEDTVLVFFGKGQTLANVKKLCAGTKAQVQYLESVKGGKNSLDFQIITELGVLVGRGEADFAYVISQDKGYEAAMSALHARYASTFREVALRPSIQDCLQAAFLLRAGTREELAAALARQYGPVQGQLAYEHLEALLTPPPVQEAAAPSPAPAGAVDLSTGEEAVFPVTLKPFELKSFLVPGEVKFTGLAVTVPAEFEAFYRQRIASLDATADALEKLGIDCGAERGTLKSEAKRS